MTPDDAEIIAEARALIEREREFGNVRGAECTALRWKLAPIQGSEIGRLRRDLARIRHIADRRDGLRPNGKPRKPRFVFVRSGGSNNAA